MTHWNYRMTRHLVDDEYLYEIREVYYDDDKLSWTVDPIHASGETWQECGDDLAKMGRALGQPVLDLDTQEWITLSELHKERMAKKERRP